MAVTLSIKGAVGCLHRFMTIEDNISMYHNTIDQIVTDHRTFIRTDHPIVKPIVSVGIGDNEYERAMDLSEAGATHVLIDVAHGATMSVVKQYDLLRSRLKDNVAIIVGNFANAKSIEDFNYHSKSSKKMDAVKLGIGGGSMCTTRIVTGSGRSTLSSIIDCRRLGIPSIADGGLRTSGDIAKALAAGASAVMLGGMLSGTLETPGNIVNDYGMKMNDDMMAQYGGSKTPNKHLFKYYAGSASKDSYERQGKTSSYISPEGETTLVPYKGPVANILQQIEGGLRSALTYSGASDILMFRENAQLVEVTTNTAIESKPHGVK
jgi:IMP dehydrogenase